MIRTSVLTIGLAMAFVLSPALSIGAETKQITVLAFTASWCGQCKLDKPTVTALSKRGKVLVLDVDKYPKYAQAYKADPLPMYVVLVGKKEVYRSKHVSNIAKVLR